jgi:hypothetical protein
VALASLEGNVFGEDLTLYPSKREHYPLPGLQDDLAAQQIGEKKRNLRTIRRFDDAVSYRIDTFDYSPQAASFLVRDPGAAAYLLTQSRRRDRSCE